jgi:hypothetical protein
MNIFEMAMFIGFPSVVAFIFLIGKTGSFSIAIAIGFGSSFVSLLILVLFSFIYKHMRGRHFQKNPVLVWAVLAALMSAGIAFYCRMHHTSN